MVRAGYRCRVGVIAGSILLLGACGGTAERNDAAENAATRGAAGGTAAAPSGDSIWRVAERWRVDGTEGNRQPFADLRDFIVTPHGDLWVLDYKDQRIRRFDATGAPREDVGARGAGPGELAGANGLLVVDNGTVWANDPRNGRLTVFDTSGRYLQQHVLPIGDHWLRWDAWIDRTTGHVMDPFAERPSGSGGSQRRWRRVALDGTVRDTVAIPSCQQGDVPLYSWYQGRSLDGQASMFDYYPFTDGGGAAPDGRGGLWCAVRTSTRAARLRIGGTDTLAETRPEVAVMPVSDTERVAAIEAARRELAQFPINDFDPSRIPATKPPIMQLSIDEHGRLWVQRALAPGASATTYDVHDSTGTRLAQVTIPYRPAAAGPALRARGRDLWVAVRDVDDVVSIAHFSIVP
jgi:hypothetical protein